MDQNDIKLNKKITTLIEIVNKIENFNRILLFEHYYEMNNRITNKYINLDVFHIIIKIVGIDYCCRFYTVIEKCFGKIM